LRLRVGAALEQGSNELALAAMRGPYERRRTASAPLVDVRPAGDQLARSIIAPELHELRQ
jgi:hypothetical protein